MHHNYRRRFDSAQYNYLDSRYFNLKWYRTHYNRQQRRRELALLRRESWEQLAPRCKSRDFCGSFF